MTNVDFTFSDTIAGYVTGYDDETDSFGLRTSDGREFQAFFSADARMIFGDPRTRRSAPPTT